MIRLAPAALVLVAANAGAATAYVTDELVLNVFSEQNQQGQRLATLHSGADVDTLSINGDYTQVRLANGVTGWVKSTFLTTNVPATVRAKQLQEELDRNRATTPGLAEAAARSELDRLQGELADKQAELDALRSQTRTGGGPSPPAPSSSIRLGTAACVVLVVGGVCFWLGYVTLARRIRKRFGGLKVY